jgi:hypothetical protein
MERITPDGLALYREDYKLVVEWPLFGFPPGSITHDGILNSRGALTNPVGEVIVGHRAKNETVRIWVNICRHLICEAEARWI